MLQQDSAENRTATHGILLALGVTWSILACGLTLSVYKFHLSGVIPYVLALIPALPLCAMIVVALRKRASQLDSYVRKYYVGAIICMTLLLIETALLVFATTHYVRGPGSAVLMSMFPLVVGGVPALLLVTPKRMLRGNLGDSMLPIRIKLVTPALRRFFRMGALYIVYITLSFASAFLFDGNNSPTGVLAYAVALFPVLPLFGLIPIYNMYMEEEPDEFQRHLFQQSILLALLGTLIISSVMGRLQEHALIFHRHPNFFRPYSVFPVFYWLQLEAVFLVNAVQAVRISAQEKTEQ
jgi:hypothetical protein